MNRLYLDRDKFRFQLKLNKFTIMDICNKMNLTRHTFNNWIRTGTAKDNIMLLAHYLDCTVEDLIK